MIFEFILLFIALVILSGFQYEDENTALKKSFPELDFFGDMCELNKKYKKK